MKFLKANMRSALTIVSVGGAFLASWFISPTALDRVSSELTALFGLMMAAVLPTMVLTATVLRAGNLPLKRIVAYSTALRQQMNVWIGLFWIALASCMFLIVGKAFNWSIIIEFPPIGNFLPAMTWNVARVFSALTWAGLAMIVVRAFSVGSGIISLMRLSSEIAVGEARARDMQRLAEGKDAVSSLQDTRPLNTYVDWKAS